MNFFGLDSRKQCLSGNYLKHFKQNEKQFGLKSSYLFPNFAGYEKSDSHRQSDVIPHSSGKYEKALNI